MDHLWLILRLLIRLLGHAGRLIWCRSLLRRLRARLR